MCLKYFVRHAACEHHEYLGSQHCSSTPCDLSKQHFHYLVDNYPIPRPSDLQHGVLTCTTCVNERGDGLDPEKLPVKYYDPTNNYQVKEIKPTGYKLPIRVVKVETEDVQAEAAKAEGSETAEAEASETSEAGEDDNDYNNDYKSLSSADEDEWELRYPGQDTRTHTVQGEPIALSNRVPFQGQPNTLPTDLGYWQDAPFVPPH